MKVRKTPTQKMMIWILNNISTYLEDNIEIDKSLDDKFDIVCRYEYNTMKEIFFAGIMLGNGAYQLKKDLDLDKEFHKTYKQIFPEE
jgi:hypothetical protein